MTAKDVLDVVVDPTLREELGFYFASSESLFGMRAFDLAGACALRGTGGCSDPDAVAASRHDHRGNDIARMRLIHEAICKIPRSHQIVLDATYGLHPWRTTFEEVLRFGPGTWEKLQKRFGSLAGVSLLTDAARHGFEKDLAASHGEKKGRVHTLPGWLLLVCEGREREESRKAVLVECREMLKAAVWTFWAARPLEARGTPPVELPTVGEPWTKQERALRPLRERVERAPSSESRMLPELREVG